MAPGGEGVDGGERRGRGGRRGRAVGGNTAPPPLKFICQGVKVKEKTEAGGSLCLTDSSGLSAGNLQVPLMFVLVFLNLSEHYRSSG